MKKKILAVALLASTANFAVAESVEPKDPSRARAMTGLVLGVQAGFSSGFNPPDITTVNGNNYSVSSTNGGFNFGGLIGFDIALSDMFSVGAEVDVNYTPNMYKADLSTPVGSADYNINILNIPIMATAKFVAPIGINVFAKGGINYQSASKNYDCSGAASLICPGNQTNSNWTGVLAGGVGYQIDTINIFAQYMYIFGTDLQNIEDNKAIEQGIITGGVSITLPM